MRTFLQNPLGILILLVLAGICQADTIYLKNGAKVEAPVVERTEQYIRADVNGILVTYYLEEVSQVRIKSAPEPVAVNAEDPAGLPDQDAAGGNDPAAETPAESQADRESAP